MDRENSRVWAAPRNFVGLWRYNHIEIFSETRCRFAADCTARRFLLNYRLRTDRGSQGRHSGVLPQATKRTGGYG